MSRLLPLAMGLGWLLDCILGDPQELPHPVRAIGALISAAEKLLRRLDAAGEGEKRRKRELLAGAALTLLVCAVTGSIVALLLFWSLGQSRWLGLFVMTLLCYYLFAATALRRESRRVYLALEAEELSEARQAVSRIVGRDTERLSREGVAKAAVETVAENASDGVIAPLFYLALGGPVLAWVYKAVNTLDSMVGYRNERYEYFGRASARLDDVLNFLPSRLSAFFLMGAAFLLRMDGRGAFRIWRRDRLQHKSPNSAQTESACAGALGVQLAGDAWYFGRLCEKPTIGDALRPVEREDILRVNALASVAGWLALLLALLLRVLLSL